MNQATFAQPAGSLLSVEWLNMHSVSDNMVVLATLAVDGAFVLQVSDFPAAEVDRLTAMWGQPLTQPVVKSHS